MQMATCPGGEGYEAVRHCRPSSCTSLVRPRADYPETSVTDQDRFWRVPPIAVPPRRGRFFLSRRGGSFIEMSTVRMEGRLNRKIRRGADEVRFKSAVAIETAVPPTNWVAVPRPAVPSVVTTCISSQPIHHPVWAVFLACIRHTSSRIPC